jgi:hypothetical protein
MDATCVCSMWQQSQLQVHCCHYLMGTCMLHAHTLCAAGLLSSPGWTPVLTCHCRWCHTAAPPRTAAAPANCTGQNQHVSPLSCTALSSAHAVSVQAMPRHSHWHSPGCTEQFPWAPTQPHTCMHCQYGRHLAKSACWRTLHFPSMDPCRMLKGVLASHACVVHASSMSVGRLDKYRHA